MERNSAMDIAGSICRVNGSIYIYIHTHTHTYPWAGLNLLIYIYIYIYMLLTQYCAGGKIEKNKMGRACGTHGGGETCAQGSGGET